jgi:hypothetical protein
MKQHLLDKAKLRKIAKANVQGGQNQCLNELTKMCWAIAKEGMYEKTEEVEIPKMVEEPAETGADEIVIHAFATPSEVKLTQSNENYIRVLNTELEKCSKNLGTVTKFWMSDKGFDRAWEKNC